MSIETYFLKYYSFKWKYMAGAGAGVGAAGEIMDKGGAGVGAENKIFRLRNTESKLPEFFYKKNLFLKTCFHNYTGIGSFIPGLRSDVSTRRE